jgi:hypothetical protein
MGLARGARAFLAAGTRTLHVRPLTRKIDTTMKLPASAPSRTSVTVSSLLVCLSVSASALGHAPPQATAIEWTSQDGRERAVVRTNRGFIFQGAPGGSFSLLCGEAFKSTVSEIVPFTLAGDGTILVGSYEGGLTHSSPDWCSFQPAAEVTSVYTADIARTPRDPDDLLAVALPLDGTEAVLYGRPGAGAAWRSLATLGGAPNSIRVSSADPERVYVVSMRSEGTQQVADILQSSDHGQSFTASSLPLEAQEIRAYLLEAGQSDVDRVFLRTQTADGIEPERLLLSEDGGLTFRTLFSARGPLTLVSSADGDTVWLGTFEGLFRSTDGGDTFASVEHGPERVGCLALHDDQLFACGYAHGEFGVLASRGAGAEEFAWFLRFPDVKSRLSCSAGSDEGLACGYPFEDWAAEQLEGEGAAGVPVAVPDASPAREARGSSSCGVSRPARDASHGWLPSAFALAVLVRRGRRPHPR